MDGKARAQRAEALFGAAMELDAEHRDAFLDDACRDDPALRLEVVGLLAHLDNVQTDELFPRLFGELARSSLIGQQVGSYRVLRAIGEGGMGTVYLVEREDVGQRAALKVVRDGRLATPSQLQRFLLERRVLARLEHSGIARLFDAGLIDDTLPYLVMEYVEGTPITTYCDIHRLTIDERLQLFQQVCLAVQHAHRNLIVHRDLKPSNILITRAATGGQAKLLDFGIARLLDENQSAEPALTRRGAPVMTPEYASPEQVRDEPVTTASDVYSLGVILYELLSGHRPYHTRGCTPAEIERIVCDTEPGKPSEMLMRTVALVRTDGTTETIAPDAVSSARGSKPDRLRRKLAGDLDTIVLEALRKEPSRRYASVEHLHDDIRRHLAGLPVSARADTATYRLSRFVRRHRLSVAGAATFALLLLGFSIVTAIQSARIREQAERITQERDRAEQVAGFLANLFRTLDPYADGGGPITIREVLDSGAVRLDRDFADEPQVRAEMMEVIAQAYDGLGYHSDARRLLESSLEIQLSVHGDTDPAVAGLLSQLAHVLVEQGDYRGAESLLRRNLASRRALYGDDHPYVARLLNSLAQALREQGRYAEAEPLLQEALAIDGRHAGQDGADLAQSTRGMAHMLRDRGDYAVAESFYRRALALHRDQFGEDHPESANSLINLAIILHAQGDHAESEPLFRDGLAVKRRLLGDEHDDVVMDMVGFADLLHDMGDDEGAEELYRTALTAHAHAQHDAHPMRARALLGLADLIMDRGDARAAEPLLREVLDIRHQAPGVSQEELARAQSALGACLSILGQFAEAESLLLAGYGTMKDARGDGDMATRQALEALTAHYRRAARTTP
jgi:serine/threonine-protein kinase